jgi:hypothetical protein
LFFLCDGKTLATVVSKRDTDYYDGPAAGGNESAQVIGALGCFRQRCRMA